MREGTTSRVTVAVRPYGKFYDFYSVSLENFGSTLVNTVWAERTVVECYNILVHHLTSKL